MIPLLKILVRFLLFLALPVIAQQVGSFFTAIYLNGAPLSLGQNSCSNMGQANYCCASGQSCAWDDAGKVACCAAGTNCQGGAYSAGAGAGVGAGAGQYYTSSQSTWQPQPTTSVYQGASPACNCVSPSPNVNGGVVPIVPVTVATLLTPTTPTSYYQPTTSTYRPATTTVNSAGATAVTASGTCVNGYTTIVEANVGAPTRVVGCYVIVNQAAKGRSSIGDKERLLCWVLSFLGSMVWLVW